MKKGESFVEYFTIDEKIYNGFIELFNDNNPLHVDESFAKEKGFISKVMHGNILNGFLSFFIGEKLPVKDIMLISQNVNYKSPVYLNDKLKLTAIINEYFESVGVFEIKYYFENKSKIKVANGKITIKRL